MSRTRRWMMMGLCAVAAASLVVPSLTRGDEPVSAPATAPTTAPATAPAKAATGRTMDAIVADLEATHEKFNEILPPTSMKSVGDAKFRKEHADKVIPLLVKMSDLLNEIAVTQNIPAAARDRYQFLGLALAFGDKDSGKALTDAAAGKDAQDALAAQCAMTLGNWVKSSDDAKAQQIVLDDYTVIAKANPKDNTIAETMMIMSQLGAANEEMSKKAMAVIKSTLTSPVAKQISALAEAEQAKQDLVGKPMRIGGRTITDTKFSSNELKGKVVMIDFWATWCGPCVAELPRVKALYKTYHEKGFEIIGVDCDGSDDKVSEFIKKNEMPWPQLREQTQTDEDSWHPLAKKYGVDGIPTMFLIDKKGVLRYIDAREDTEDKIKKLLEEPDPKPPAAPAPAPAK